MENVQNTYQSIFLGTAMYNTTGLKHSETDVVEEVFMDQLGLAAIKFRGSFGESILRIIWPLPGLLTILQKTFLKKLTKQDTGLVIWVHCKLYCG
jgi:hypothetical protein